MKKIILITGGQRSGKSDFAEKLALTLSDSPIYLATSRIWDEEYKKRIEIHQKSRNHSWQTIEEEKFLSRLSLEHQVIVIDCVMLWATNFFFDNQDPEQNVIDLIQEFEHFTSQNAIFIFVTNEIGLGGTSENMLQRQFIDVLGKINQHIAQRANKVHLIISGIPLLIKGASHDEKI